MDKERVFWGSSKKCHLRCFDSGFILFCLVYNMPCHSVGWVLFICSVFVFWFSSGYRKVLYFNLLSAFSLTILLICFSYLFLFLRVWIPGSCTCLFALRFIINYLFSSDGVSCFEFHCCSLNFYIIISRFDVIFYNLCTNLSNMCHILVLLPDHLQK